MKIVKTGTALLGVALVFAVGIALGSRMQPPVSSAVVAEAEASRDDFDWGTLFSYFEGETFGTENALAAVAVINAGMEIHPPHRHTEEEYMLVTQGEGTWHLNGEDFPAAAGDMLYAAPWDVHGITNTGSAPLHFVVWKWDNKGIERPADPEK
ncbi:MAG: cupin domain-containing protein [Rhodothermales bacterium]